MVRAPARGSYGTLRRRAAGEASEEGRSGSAKGASSHWYPARMVTLLVHVQAIERWDEGTPAVEHPSTPSGDEDAKDRRKWQYALQARDGADPFDKEVAIAPSLVKVSHV